MDCQLLVCSLVVLCVISRVLSRGKCPPLAQYMYSYGEYCAVLSWNVFSFSQ